MSVPIRGSRVEGIALFSHPHPDERDRQRVHAAARSVLLPNERVVATCRWSGRPRTLGPRHASDRDGLSGALDLVSSAIAVTDLSVLVVHVPRGGRAWRIAAVLPRSAVSRARVRATAGDRVDVQIGFRDASTVTFRAASADDAHRLVARLAQPSAVREVLGPG